MLYSILSSNYYYFYFSFGTESLIPLSTTIRARLGLIRGYQLLQDSEQLNFTVYYFLIAQGEFDPTFVEFIKHSHARKWIFRPL
jgi:hypothetical protein